MSMKEPITYPIRNELLVRNIYCTSQYSGRGLKRTYLYPNYKRESRDFPGYHTCRVSVQRLCYGGLDGVIRSAYMTKSPTQTLVGFAIAHCDVVARYGFILEPAAHSKNPYHAHIYIPELDLPFSSEVVIMDVMSAGLRRRLDEMTAEFEFVKLENLSEVSTVHYPSPLCLECLKEVRQ